MSSSGVSAPARSGAQGRARLRRNRAFREDPHRVDLGRLVVTGAALALGYALVPLAGNLEIPRWHVSAVIGPLWVTFGLAAWWSLRGAHAGAGLERLVVVVLLAAVCQVPGILVAPQSSTDAYRYVWDGRVQLSGTSPYRYAPLDDALRDLRDPYLFPGLGPRESSAFATLTELPSDREALRDVSRGDPRTLINRPRVPTIYPPVAQAWFTGLARVTPWAWGTRGLQIGCALLAVGLTVALGLSLAGRGRDPARALLWGWSPVVVLETGNGAHVDIVAAALVLAAVVWWRRALLAGALIGLAAGVKLLPILLLPAWVVLRRRNGGATARLVAIVGALGVLVLAYLPHVLAAGELVLGYLPSYLVERGLEDGQGFAVLDLLAPGWAVRPLAVALLVGGGAAVWWRAEAEDPARTALRLSALIALVTTPPFAWYALPLVALAVLVDEPRWLLLPVAAYLTTSGFGVVAGGLAYLVAGLLIIALGRAPHGRRAPPAGTA